MAFFIRYQQQALQQDNKEYEQEQFRLIITTFPHYPEVVCSSYTEQKPCLDTSKLTAFSLLPKEDFKELGFKNIVITTLYPDPNTKLCSSKNVQDCGRWQLYNKQPARIDCPSCVSRATTPISLYNPLTKKYSIGLFVAEDYTHA